VTCHAFHVRYVPCTLLTLSHRSAPAEVSPHVASLRLQHRAIGTLVLPSPFVGVCFGCCRFGVPIRGSSHQQQEHSGPNGFRYGHWAERYVADCISLQIFCFFLAFPGSRGREPTIQANIRNISRVGPISDDLGFG
jgi:hypothetical protein